MNGRTILVVDDNKEFCDSIRDILELQGYKVMTAYGGRSAVELVQQRSVDLILIDLVMPEINGVTAIKLIKKVNPSLPVFVITGYSEENIIRETLQNGASKVLSKPLNFTRLLSYIESVCPG